MRKTQIHLYRIYQVEERDFTLFFMIWDWNIKRESFLDNKTLYNHSKSFRSRDRESEIVLKIYFDQKQFYTIFYTIVELIICSYIYNAVSPNSDIFITSICGNVFFDNFIRFYYFTLVPLFRHI